jgi:putative transposase
MPWKESTAVEERKQFIEAWQKQEDSLAELCRKFGISRQTGYKLIERFEEEGDPGLKDRSRAPGHSPQAMSEEVIEALVGLRAEHPRWGPRKLRAYLRGQAPDQHWPAVSSIGELLKREGLVRARRKRQRTPAYSAPLEHATTPNRVWCADFKGWFLCGNGEKCTPLTITDACSRYLIRCQSVDKADTVRSRAIFEAAFREYGLPHAIRSDNGAPFASPAPAGLSQLSVWWICLGITPERIERGCPEQNGRHERMHETLRQETADPPAGTLRQQQLNMLRFQESYNWERPHEALQYRTPGSLYAPSGRPYPTRLPEPEYPRGSIYRWISGDGQMRWANERVFLTKVLAGQQVGLVPIEETLYEIYFGPVFLGWYEESANQFVADPGKPNRRRRGRQTKSEQPGEAAALFPS